MKQTLPAGKYVICDPCYVIPNDEWDRVLQETGFFGYEKGDMGGVFTDSVTGKEYAVFSTAYGDGVYGDNMGHSFPVDAGCIGCLPLAMCEDGEPGGFLVIDRSQPFAVGYDDGEITFGAIHIDTAGRSGDYDDEGEE